jgi:hypothetical protein
MKHGCWVQLAHYSIQHRKKSGSSHTPKRQCFAYLKNYVGFPAIEVGDTKFELCNSKEMSFNIVEHVLRLTGNLNSLGPLVRNRFS